MEIGSPQIRMDSSAPSSAVETTFVSLMLVRRIYRLLRQGRGAKMLRFGANCPGLDEVWLGEA
jgi:hypothetical protein